MKHIKLMLATAITLIALSATVGSATAAEFEIRPGGESTATSLSLVTFASGLNVTCNMEVLWILNTGKIAKTAGTAFGEIRRVTTSNETHRTTECNGGSRVEILEINGAMANPANVSWLVVYSAILGTLSTNVTGLLYRINGTKFLVTTRLLGTTVTCLFEGSVGALLGFAGNNPYTSTLIRILERDEIPRHSAALNSAACPASARVAGAFSLAPVETITRS